LAWTILVPGANFGNQRRCRVYFPSLLGGAARALACGFALMLVTATAPWVLAEEDADAARELRHAKLLDKAEKEGLVRVILRFKEDRETQELVATEGTAAALASVQSGVMERLTSSAAVDLETVKTFDLVPGMAMAVSREALEQILADTAVSEVYEDELNAPNLFDSIPLIDADLAHNAGYRGSGQAVAILDTGVNKNHPFLAGRVVSEACYSTSGSCGSGCTATSLCPGGASSSTAANSALDCSLSVTGCGHGTHVAGIAAGRNGASSGGTIQGVGRDAWVIAVKIFTEFNSSYCASVGQGNNPCVLAYTSDIIKGLERVYALRNTYAIAAANMSLGGGAYSNTCDSDTRKPVIDSLRSAGIATVISSGNNGFNNQTGAPGCISTAITVGSTTKGDVESSFSNAASWVDVLAPGSNICASVNGSPNCGGSGSTGFGFKSGTSMAAPHVTGAWAVMKSKNGTASVSSVEAALAAELVIPGG